MKKTIVFTALIILLAQWLHPCFIFKAAKDGRVFAGNNEDYSDPMTKYFIFPREENKHGRIYFGFSLNYPQGGMNDQGLFFDWVAGYKTDWKSNPKKKSFSGNLNEKIMEECATVEEVIAIYLAYNVQSLKYARCFWADATGTSVIILWTNNGLKFLRSKKGYQGLGYKENIAKIEARKFFLSGKAALTFSLENLKLILDAAHQEGRYPTQYSNLCDLKNKTVYLYFFQDYDRVVKIDLEKELKKGESNVRMFDLFPGNRKAHAWNEDFKKKLLEKHRYIKDFYKKKRLGGLEKSEKFRFSSREMMTAGLYLMDYKETAKALETLQLTVRQFPDDWRSHANVAYIYKEMGCKQKARECYKKALERSPGNTFVLERLNEIKNKKQ